MRSTAEKHIWIQDVDDSHFLEIDCRNFRIRLFNHYFSNHLMREVEKIIHEWTFDHEPTVSECGATLHEAAEVLGLVCSLV